MGNTLDKNQASTFLRLAQKYKPESKVAKKERLMEMAQAKADGKEIATKKPHFLKHGLDHITNLIEMKRAKLVVIAHDVDPIELVCWLPALCRKKDVSYCIIKGKARLGQLVGKKTASCVAVTAVKREDQQELENLSNTFQEAFNDNVDLRRRWGGGVMGLKSQHVTAKKQKIKEVEEQKKMGLTVA